VNDNLKKPTAENAFSTPIVKDIFGVSADFLGQFRTWLEQNPPAIPVSQIVGFSQFTAQANSVATRESTISTTYVNLTTAGPSLSGLPDGQYLFLFGCDAFNSVAGNQLTMSIKVNSTAAADSDATLADAPAATYKVCLMRAVTKTLANGGNNTITCQYRVSSGTGSFENRWLIALRFAN